jgi:hypothetical protein
MTEWISVKDRLPEIRDKTRSSSESQKVLILDSCGDMYVGYLNFYGISGNRKEECYSWYENSTGCGCCSENINATHWMSLPKPPEDL